MDISQFLYNFASILISLLILYIFKGFLPKYFEAKGANQATKEDIGEITSIVENVKYDLLEQMELLKAKTSFRNEHILNLKNAERDAIFSFNKHISAWIYFLIRFKFSQYNLNNYKDLKLVFGELSRRQYECDLAEAHLTLFIHDKEFVNLKYNLIISIINHERIIENSINEIFFLFSKCDLELEHETDSHECSIIRGNLNKKLLQLIEASRVNSLEKYKEVNKFYVQMTELINKRLKQLEDDEINIHKSSSSEAQTLT
ncbi:hypothetical protein [Algoriphagus winogradskyi]|uniref:Uncharacterized protein n=1 Tax=Algoriphagus winogradskyi TaxID=237017 RepID=A0ABY1PGX8_9BACT|nr:hypothetical protein [Algoriphagus winogradskyi]SMP34128.1 hypothetical protein SAMN06265367_109101 [Algoriphagus winogradskyi]